VRPQYKMTNVLLAMMSIMFILDSCSHESSGNKATTTKDSVAISGWFRLVDTDSTPVLQVLLFNHNEFEIATTLSRTYWTDASRSFYSITGLSSASEIVYLMHGDESRMYQVASLPPTMLPSMQFYSIGAHDSLVLYLEIPEYLLLKMLTHGCRVTFMSIPIVRADAVRRLGIDICKASYGTRVEIQNTVKVEKMSRFHQYETMACSTQYVNDINTLTMLDEIVDSRCCIRPAKHE